MGDVSQKTNAQGKKGEKKCFEIPNRWPEPIIKKVVRQPNREENRFCPQNP